MLLRGSSLARSRETFYVGLGALAILLSSVPYLYGWLKTPPGFVYTGLTSNIDDCLVYFSWIREYADGRFAQRDLFSTEAQHPVLFYAWFWILGLLSKAVGTIGAFHCGRVLGGVGLLVAIRWLLTLTVSDEKSQKFGFALACFASGIGWLPGFEGGAKFVSRPIDLDMPEAITFQTLVYSPLFAPMTASIVVFACGILRSERSKKLSDVWPSAVAGAILGNSHTYDIVPLFLATGAWRLFSDLSAKKFDRAGWLRLIVVGLAALPTTAFNFWASRADPLFFARVWKNQPTLTPMPWWVLLGWGIPYALALVAAHRKNRSRFVDSSALALLVCWAATHLLASYLPVPVQRKFLMGAHVPICALAGVGLAGLLARIPGDLPKALGPLIVGLCAIGNLTGLLGQIGKLDANAGDTSSRPYLSFAERDALAWIEKNATDGAVIVAPDPSAARRFPFVFLPQLAPQVAGIAHQTVYNGHWSETLDYTRKIGATLQFFQAEADDAFRKNLVRENGIGYVLYSNSLAEPLTDARGNVLYSPVVWNSPEALPDWLEIAYQNSELTILKTKPPSSP